MIGAPIFPLLQPLRCHLCKADIALGEGHSVDVDQEGNIVRQGTRVVMCCALCCPLCAEAKAEEGAAS